MNLNVSVHKIASGIQVLNAQELISDAIEAYRRNPDVINH